MAIDNALALVSGAAQKKALSPDSFCVICDLPSRDRREIEEMMACHVSEKTIASIFKQKTGIDIAAKTINGHIEHLPAKYFTYREIIDRRARESGISLEDDSQAKLTPMALVESIMNDSMSAIVAHPNTTNPMVGLQAAKIMMDVEDKRNDKEDVAKWILKFKQLVNAIKSVCSRDQIDKILEIVSHEQ